MLAAVNIDVKAESLPITSEFHNRRFRLGFYLEGQRPRGHTPALALLAAAAEGGELSMEPGAKAASPSSSRGRNVLKAVRSLCSSSRRLLLPSLLGEVDPDGCLLAAAAAPEDEAEAAAVALAAVAGAVGAPPASVASTAAEDRAWC
jgi:ADP-ribose pyrophosphatase YjhB (NUDIX family)